MRVLASAYHTVSEPAVTVIAGVTNIDLLAKEHLRKPGVGKRITNFQERLLTLERWRKCRLMESRRI